MSRIVLFMLTNVAVLALLSIIFKVFGLEQVLYQSGIRFDYWTFMIFASLMGFGGALVSLLISKWSAIHLMGAQVIQQPSSQEEHWLLATVQNLAQAAGIPMPEVAIFQSPDPNAFATGPSKNNSLVAVSTGLLQGMEQQEIEGVLGHEITHIANGDMVTMALLQGVLNTFVIIFARIIGLLVDRLLSRGSSGNRNSGPGMGYFLASMVAQVVLGMLASMIAMWFSRVREFRADAGSARITGKTKMIAALQRLQAMHEPSQLPQQLAAFGINNGMAGFFRSHPPLADRIAALQRL